MLWFLKKDRDVKQIHTMLERSFSNVKNDTQNIFQWLSYLYQKNQEQEHHIKQLQHDLSLIPKSPEAIKTIIDRYYSFDDMMRRIQELNHKVTILAHNQESKRSHHAQPSPQLIQQPPEHLNKIEQRLSQLEHKQQATVREKVVRRVTKNSKEYVKSLILSYIRKYTQISGLQLKEMVVDDQGLCSKSSFYRLLEEVEALEEIGSAHKGRQKYYVYKPLKLH